MTQELKEQLKGLLDWLVKWREYLGHKEQAPGRWDEFALRDMSKYQRELHELGSQTRADYSGPLRDSWDDLQIVVETKLVPILREGGIPGDKERNLVLDKIAEVVAVLSRIPSWTATTRLPTRRAV